MSEVTMENPFVLDACVSKIFPRQDSSGNRIVLSGARLAVKEGDVVMLRGKSGSGKSTLIKILGGLLPPTMGYVRWNGNTVYDCTEIQIKDRPQCCAKSCRQCEASPTALLSAENLDMLRGRHISFIFQEPNLINNFTAVENVMLPLVIQNTISVDDMLARARDFLQMVDLELHLYDRKAERLSGGEKQRVNLARAFAANTPVILADEPFAHLDSKTAESAWQGILAYKKQRKACGQDLAIIIISHDDALFYELKPFKSDDVRIATHHYRLTDGVLKELPIPEKHCDSLSPVTGNCPRCDAAFEPIEIAGVPVDRCRGCNGLWLDDLELCQVAQELSAGVVKILENA
jgi:ABC-type lipoprotein export system ATPase subunit